MNCNIKPYLLIAGKFAVIVVAVLLFSCSPVKHVPDNRYLLNKVEVNVDNPAVIREEAKIQIRQKENYKILGFAKFHLWMYNLSSKNKPESWLKKIGEPPEVFDESLVDASSERLKQYLGNKGFFRAKIETEISLNENKKKANVNYKITTGEQYIIRNINYHIDDPVLKTIFINDSAQTFISPGTPFDFNLLEEQQTKIVNLFKDEGYYYFSKDDVKYLADSSLYSKEVVLDLFVGSSLPQDDLKKFRPYYLNNFYISVIPGSVSVSSAANIAGELTDTVRWDNYSLLSGSEFRYRTGLFRNLLQMKSGNRYRISDARHTFDAFNRLRQFRFVDIQFEEPFMAADTNLLDCYIRLAPLSKQAVSFDIEGTNTSGNLGVAGNINYQHRNLLRGAEVLQLNIKGAIERQQRTRGNVTEYFNTREIGPELSLTFPKIVGPRQLVNAFWNLLPKTVLTFGYNYQRRPEYTRTISSVRFGYDWMTSENIKQIWNVVDFNMVKLYKFDPEFIDRIKDLYIKSSFTDHLILASGYSFIYNTQRLGVKQNYTYLKFNAEMAGNLLYMLSETFNGSYTQVVDSIGPGSASFYTLLNTRFAQYVKSDVEFRYGHIIDKYNSVVGRAFLGVGLPYGNFDVLPFEKKYFTGGANGIRAWQVRSLGPGTYKAPSTDYPNQSSDIKLEANLEYRFELMKFLEGALFFDAGNIWAINKKDNRPGAQFKFTEFYKQIALGTGAGFRFDFNYFIFRFDLGMKLRDPSQASGKGWTVGHRKLTGDDFNISFAIGYPF